MNKIIFLILLVAVACSPAPEENKKEISDAQNMESEVPCDDEEAPKVEINEEGINLLEEDEGCKLEQ